MIAYPNRDKQQISALLILDRNIRQLVTNDSTTSLKTKEITIASLNANAWMVLKKDRKKKTSIRRFGPGKATCLKSRLQAKDGSKVRFP